MIELINCLWKMEQKATINSQWRMSTIWSFLGCLILLLILNQKKTSSLLALTTSSLQQNPESRIVGNTSPPAVTASNLRQTPKSKPVISNNITAANIPVSHTTSSSRGANDLVTNFAEKVPPSETAKKKCNIFEGRWVYDPNDHLPRYNATRCGEIISQKFRCLENGRPDSDYEKWRWEATDCDIPLFNGTYMLERLRNKRMVLVGDSLSRNQWISLACFLYSSISDPSRAELRGQSLRAKDYNFTLEFHWSSFLVQLNITHESSRKVLMLDKIADISEKWRGANVMVFNSWHWWTHPDSIKAWDVYEYKGQLIEKMPRELAFERGMRTWATWMKTNVDPKKTTVIFRSPSEAHFGKHGCFNSTQPITNIDSFKSAIPNSFIMAFERVNKEMGKLQVKYLNITKLSQYRSDAHQSVYFNLDWKTGSKSADCGHWCVPGVPDTWNRLLYALLFFDA